MSGNLCGQPSLRGHAPPDQPQPKLDRGSTMGSAKLKEQRNRETKKTQTNNALDKQMKKRALRCETRSDPLFEAVITTPAAHCPSGPGVIHEIAHLLHGAATWQLPRV